MKAVFPSETNAGVPVKVLISESCLMGVQGNSSFCFPCGNSALRFLCRLAREREWREKKKAQKVNAYQEKANAYNEKEAAKMDQLRAMVAMAGGKITIAKRQ